MQSTIDIIILTMSSKNDGYCIAGIDTQNGQWVRLVSNDEKSHGALSDSDILYPNGNSCSILDVARVPIISIANTQFQPENILIDNAAYWEKLGKSNLADTLQLHPAEDHHYIFGDTDYSISESQIRTLGHSLVLVEIKNLVISHPKVRKTKAMFDYANKKYENISVTDPIFYNVPDGTEYKKALIVVSLPDCPYNDLYYKFIAKIFCS